MKTATNARPGKKGFQPTTRSRFLGPMARPENPYSHIRPIELPLTPGDIFRAWKESQPIYMVAEDMEAEVCPSCADKRRSGGQHVMLCDLDDYEMQEAYLTGWPCTDCGEWAVAPMGCIYSDADDSECVTEGIVSMEVMEVHENGGYAWRLGCVNPKHQVARLQAETDYPAEASETLIAMTWLEWRAECARRGLQL